MFGDTGTAGCVLASRISEGPAIRILLLETGKRQVQPLKGGNANMVLQYFK